MRASAWIIALVLLGCGSDGTGGAGTGGSAGGGGSSGGSCGGDAFAQMMKDLCLKNGDRHAMCGDASFAAAPWQQLCTMQCGLWTRATLMLGACPMTSQLDAFVSGLQRCLASPCPMNPSLSDCWDRALGCGCGKNPPPNCP